MKPRLWNIAAIFLLFLVFSGGVPSLLAQSASENPPLSYKGPQEVVFIPWGKGPFQAGKIKGQEAADEAPNSLAVSPTGEIYLLDQVNSRVLKFTPEGRPVAMIRIPVETADDLRVAGDGKLILLEQTGQRQLMVVLKPSGELFAQHPTGGERGDIIGVGMELYPDGLWLRHRDSRLIHLLNADLKPVQKKTIPGDAFSSDRRKVGQASMGLGDRSLTLKISDANTGATLSEKTIPPEPELFHTILCFQSDQARRFHLVRGWLQEKEQRGPKGRPAARGLVGLALDENLKEVASFRFTLPPDTVDGPFRQCDVTPDGSVYYLLYTSKGVKILRWKLEK